MRAPIPIDEARRLENLRGYEVLDTPPEQAFEDLTLLAAHICEVPMAMVAFVDEKRQWFKSRRGLDVSETARDVAFCAHAVLNPAEVMEVPDTLNDPRFCNNPLVTGEPHVRFYAGAPLVSPDHRTLGTICVMDQKPRHLTDDQLAALRALSRRVVAQLEWRREQRRIAEETMRRGHAGPSREREQSHAGLGREEARRLLAIEEKSRRALLSVLEDEKKAGRELRESEERFRQLIENSTDVIIVIDGAGVIGFQSPSMQRSLGYKPEELQGKSVLDIIHPDDKPAAVESIQRAISNPDAPRPIEYRIRHRDESWRIFQSIGKSMVGSSGRIEIVVNSRDVTESRLLEEKFLRAQRMEAIGTLASGVAHDLNNILTPMLMVAGLLKETLADQRDRDMLTLVEGSARRGASIISQLLTFSRGIEGARTCVQPHHLVREMVNIVQETFPRNIEIRQNLADDLWGIVVDATQLHQVLLNLCVNARDAMVDGGRLTLAAQNVELTEKDVQAHSDVSAGPYVQLTVSDTGCGIPAAIIGRIFDPFFTTKQIGKGTGLGLSTVIGIVKSHKGFVTVDSAPGRGTSFGVYLPAVGATKAEPVAIAALHSTGNDELILLVDDEPDITETLRGLLETHRYRVVAAANGEEAIRIFIEHSEAVQVVVTDMMMPVMGGPALINTLRVLKPAVRFIAMTGLGHEEDTAELAGLGVTKILAKPFGAAELLEAVYQTLKP